MTGKCLYWAVPCNCCGGMIALNVVKHYEGKDSPVPEPSEEPFAANCQLCGKESRYAKDRIVVWAGPEAAPEYRPHAAFDESAA